MMVRAPKTVGLLRAKQIAIGTCLIATGVAAGTILVRPTPRMISPVEAESGFAATQQLPAERNLSGLDSEAGTGTRNVVIDEHSSVGPTARSEAEEEQKAERNRLDIIQSLVERAQGTPQPQRLTIRTKQQRDYVANQLIANRLGAAPGIALDLKQKLWAEVSTILTPEHTPEAELLINEASNAELGWQIERNLALQHFVRNGLLPQHREQGKRGSSGTISFGLPSNSLWNEPGLLTIDYFLDFEDYEGLEAASRVRSSSRHAYRSFLSKISGSLLQGR